MLSKGVIAMFIFLKRMLRTVQKMDCRGGRKSSEAIITVVQMTL